jgi:hypothetical protein
MFSFARSSTLPVDFRHKRRPRPSPYRGASTPLVEAPEMESILFPSEISLLALPPNGYSFLE